MGILANLKNTVASYVFPWAEFNATPGTLSDGDQGPLQIDANGNLKVAEQFAPSFEDNSLGVARVIKKPVASATYAPSTYNQFGAVTKALIKAFPGNVFGFVVNNQNAVVRYFQLHNKASAAPAATEVPLHSFAVQPGQTLVIGEGQLTEAGVNLATGIGWAISTTSATFTDAATVGEHTTFVAYI